MDLVDNKINQRIMFGSIPSMKLYPTKAEPVEYDIKQQAQDGMFIFQNNPRFFTTMFILSSKRVQELCALDLPECYSQRVNTIINANCPEEYLNVTGSLQLVSTIFPAITPLDKVLWCGATEYQHEIEYNSSKIKEDFQSIMFAWIYLLNYAQQKEIETGRTIKIETVHPSTNILDLILNGFKNQKPRKHFRHLNSDELNSLRKYINEREALQIKIHQEWNEGKELALSSTALFGKRDYSKII